MVKLGKFYRLRKNKSFKYTPRYYENEGKDSPYKISQVEMKLKGLTLDQVTQYLYKIETSRNMVNIKRISLTKSDDKEGILNVTLQVETLEV
jgi:general secretion pathway protein M